MSAHRSFVFRTWGGKRRGAGRKPTGPTAGVPHHRRPKHQATHPVHVTLRAVRNCPSLRSGRVFGTLRSALGRTSSDTFRVAHFPVQTNHVHLIVEASRCESLTRGMQGLGIRLAKAVNRACGRRGRVWGDRYHSRALRMPREVRNALVYVLLNGRKHHVSGIGIDPCSSGSWFDGWANHVAAPAASSPIARARTWLLRTGWRRNGLIRFDHVPRSRLRR